MGKTHSKPLAARHGRGTAWARHGNSMLCVNRPLVYHMTEPAASGHGQSVVYRSHVAGLWFRVQSGVLTDLYLHFHQTFSLKKNSALPPVNILS
jgi:hypothetical protein